MNGWEFFDGIVRNPPAVIIAIVIAIIAAHALKLACEFITNRRHPNSLIITLEILVVMVLGYLVIHLYLEKPLAHESTKSQYEPFLMACMLVLFSIISSFVYILFKAAVREHDGEKNLDQ